MARVTGNVAGILAVMLSEPERSWYGLEIARTVDIGHATVYAALTRLERASWIVGEWEDADPRDEGRPRRRLYRLTEEGARHGGAAVEAHRARLSSHPQLWRPTPRRSRT
jgi:PadR family transcriptional regulator, regulatory protein PadR